MAITHYIDTSLPEISRSRVKSLTDRVPEQFPVLVYGDERQHNFVFHNAGVVEGFSGSNSFSLSVTVGSVQNIPITGSYVLTCGTSATINALADASTIEAALNGLSTITSEGGVKVIGKLPNFIVTWNTTGAKTAITVDAAKLVPTSAVTVTITQTGSGSVINQASLRLKQGTISTQTNWTPISSPANGWTGIIPTDTAAALTNLQLDGMQVGKLVQISTLLNVEVLTNTNVPTCYYQTPITIRDNNA